MHNGEKMIKAIFLDDKFSIIMSIDKFKLLWDESYAFLGEYGVDKLKDILGISSDKIDLNSFVAEQILSILNENGEEDESANNECFEDYDALNCSIKDVMDGSILITGKLISFN